MYSNFVKPGLFERDIQQYERLSTLSGEQAKKMYLEEVEIETTLKKRHCVDDLSRKKKAKRLPDLELSDKDLFMTVQNDDLDTLRRYLNTNPDKINKVDNFGWSLLMIACQANSVAVVKELLKRGIDTSIRDKSGISAQSILIKNKNYELIDIFLSKKQCDKETVNEKINIANNCNDSTTSDFFCDTCNANFTINKNDHLSSTVHNINLSKNKKIPSNYVIPQNNKGYQIMVKVGWDKESGLGPDGTGKKYPIKTVQKKDRKGLGHGKKAIKAIEETKSIKCVNRKMMVRDHETNRNIEVRFRREFY